jgi:iron complex outermembrane receptor protein
MASTTRARADAGGDAASEVTVRGTATSTAPGFVSKASEADATREVTDVASLLEPLPGVHVRRLGADDTFSTLSIRGSTSSEVAVLFAGVPLTGAADPSLDLASLPLWPGARVKVYRSFTPAAVGSGSLGGTLALEPPKPTDLEGTLAWAGVGSLGEARLRLADVRAIDDGRGRIVTAFSASRATDDFTYYDPTRSTATTPVYAPRTNAQYAGLQGFVAIALPLGAGTVTTTTLVQSRLQHLPGSVEDPTLFATLSTNRELVSVDLARPVSAASAIHLIGWARRDEIATHDQPVPSRSHWDVLLATDDVTSAAGAAAAWRVAGKSASAEARLDGSFERFAPGSDQSELGAEPGATRASAGGGADVDWRPLRRWSVSASGRVDANVDAADALPAGSPPGNAPAQGTDVRPTGHVGTEVLVGPVTLATHGGAIGRAPSFVERYGGGGVLANPTLEPEGALTADVGARYAGRVAGFRAQVEIDGFATHASELITLVPEGALGLLKAVNIATARIFGVESSVDVRGHGVDLRAGYTGLLTYNDDPSVAAGSASRPPLPGRPAHDFVGDVAYSIGPVRVRYGVDVVARLFADDAGLSPVPDRVLQSTGVRVAVPWVRELRLAFDVSNLFDVRTGLTPSQLPGLAPQQAPIGDQFGYPLPGRTFLFTVRWTPE